MIKRELCIRCRCRALTRGTLDNGMLLSVVDLDSLPAILNAAEGILAVTAVNSRGEGVFLPLQPPPFERVLSSDIKLYHMHGGDGRAYLALNALILPDTWQGREDALQHLRERDVIHGDAALPANPLTQPGKVEIVAYSDTEVRLAVEAPEAAWLILRDAWYPGWQATVNGAAAPVYRANVMFRAVEVAAGESEVEFRFEPALWRAAIVAGAVAWVMWLMAFLVYPPWSRRR